MALNKHLSLPVLFALVFTWIWMVPWSTSPFQAEKSVALVLPALYVIPWLPRRGRGLLLAVLALSLTVAYPAWRVALWGNDYRWMGMLAWMAAGVLTWAWSTSGEPSESLALLLTSVATLSLSILILARVFPAFFIGDLALWHPAFAEGGLLGNRAFLGTALAPLVMYWAGFAIHAFHRRMWRQGLWWGFYALLALVGLFLSHSRGGWLGIGIALIVVGGLVWSGSRRYAWWVGTGGMAVGGILWGMAHPHSSGWEFIYRNGTLPQRWIVWQATLRLLLRHPWRALVGFGADTLGLYFPEVYPTVLMQYESDGRAHVFDRAHNILLDIWVQFGGVGLLIGCIGAGWVVYRWLHLSQRDARVWGALAGWVTLLGTWLVHFPTPTTLLMAGLLAAESTRSPRPALERLPRGPLFFGYGLGIGVLACLWMGIPMVMWGYGTPVMYTGFGLGILWALESLSLVRFGWGEARFRRAMYALAVTVLVGLFFTGDVVLGWATSLNRGGHHALAISLGQRAWPLCPRERTAWQMASLWLDRNASPTAEDVQQALFWLHRAPEPHSAAWWFVYLDTMRAAHNVGMKRREEVKRAFDQARSYFPGNIEWTFSDSPAHDSSLEQRR